MKVAIIGGGAAGYFSAINIAEKHPDYEVFILEKTSKTLQKVKVSGGGRCNVTNERSSASDLVGFYPRGQKKLHSLFKTFSTTDTKQWFSDRGVETIAEDDLRVFPLSNSSDTIIKCFESELKKHKVKLILNQNLESLQQDKNQWIINTKTDQYIVDKVVVATGSSPSVWSILRSIGFDITEIVPSLFTFNIKDQRIKDLQGISFEHAQVKVASSKLQEEGPLLITHWGMSGPAILKLSSWGAYILAEKEYKFDILVNFVGSKTADEVRTDFHAYAQLHPKRKAINYPLFDLPKRFWERLLGVCEVSDQQPFGELSKKQVNKLIEEICQGRYGVQGKSTFKEEFVTAGGVSLAEIDLKTFESKRFPGIYFAGEVLDIDALTGGFNFQACWSAAWVISESM